MGIKQFSPYAKSKGLVPPKVIKDPVTINIVPGGTLTSNDGPILGRFTKKTFALSNLTLNQKYSIYVDEFMVSGVRQTIAHEVAHWLVDMMGIEDEKLSEELAAGFERYLNNQQLKEGYSAEYEEEIVVDYVAPTLTQEAHNCKMLRALCETM